MPPADSTVLIVARFLKSNRYNESFDAFIAEAGLEADAGDIRKGDLTLETLLEEKKTFDVSVKFEKLSTGDGLSGWSEPAPTQDHRLQCLPSRSNLICTSVQQFEYNGIIKPFLLASSADRRLHIVHVPECTLHASLVGLQDAPILSCAMLDNSILLTTSMSGQLVASDLKGNKVDNRRDHTKYLIQVAVHHSSNNNRITNINGVEAAALIATAGWDNKVQIYCPSATSVATTANSNFQIGDPISRITLQTKPEAILWLSHPTTSDPVLLVTRTDSNHIYFYTAEPTPRLLGTQNLAPHSNAWVAFTPSALALCPIDSTLLAVGTNSVPHMKLLIVRLLVPAYHPSTEPLANGPGGEIPRPTQASQAHAALATAEKESAAILIHATTLAPQTPYSNPTVAWRPDGSGVWVNGDDGCVRGIEASTGKLVATLRGHEEGSKVRCLWAGNVGVDGGGEEELLVSGGFDQRLVVWKIPS